MDKVKNLRREASGLWVWRPPEAARKAGVARYHTWKDGRTARFEAEKLNQKIDQWRKGKRAVEYYKETMTVRQLVANFLVSTNFKNLASSSKKAYDMTLQRIINTPSASRTFGDRRLCDLTVALCSNIYDAWVADSTATAANTNKTIFGVLMGFAISRDVIQRNPMASVKPLKTSSRNIVWTREEVEKTLDIAFSDPDYRSTGLLILLCYEWAQRPIDISTLRWEDIDWSKQCCTIRQTKRKATVHLPISDELEEILRQQEDEYGEQEWVIPFLRADRKWIPLPLQRARDDLSKIHEEAGLSDLRIGELRKTAITEMVEAGLDQVGILPVTGHKSLHSLNPYMKPTLRSAKAALDRRKQNVKD